MVSSLPAIRFRESARRRNLTATVLCGLVLATCVRGTAAISDAGEKAQQAAVKWVDSNQRKVVEMSDSIWKYAEPPFEEFRTYMLLTDVLRAAGFIIQEHAADLPTAFVASFSHGAGTPVVGIVAEYDTPTMAGLSQQAAVPYRAELVPGDYGHGCGHNMVAASSVAAAIAVKDAMVRAGVSGTIKFFGSPAEEELTGKVYMVAAGLFRDVHVALAWHPGPNFEARYGVNSAMHRVKFTFTGKTPDEAVRAAMMFQDWADVTDARITLRGSSADARISVSAPTFAEAERRMDTIRKEAVRVASQTGTQVEDHLVIATYERLPNERLVKLMDETMRLFAPPTYTSEEMEFARQISTTFAKAPPANQLMPRLLAPSRDIGSSNDNADVSRVTPFISVRGGTYVNGITSHTWQQTSLAASSIGHKGLVTMAKVVAAAALTLMTEPQVLVEVRKEFEEKTDGISYHPGVPKDRNWRWLRR
jgi:aminobenzoyl-glutamate utilization protein B